MSDGVGVPIMTMTGIIDKPVCEAGVSARTAGNVIMGDRHYSIGVVVAAAAFGVLLGIAFMVGVLIGAAG